MGDSRRRWVILGLAAGILLAAYFGVWRRMAATQVPAVNPTAIPTPAEIPTPAAIPTPAEIPTPAAIPTPTPSAAVGPTSEDSKLVDRYVAALKRGNIVFNVPAAMRYRRAHTVAVVLSPTLSAEELKSLLPDRRYAETSETPIASQMEAELHGLGFAVEPRRPALQTISSTATEWLWEVTPTLPGQRRLYLSIYVHVELRQRTAPLVLRTLEKEIDVQVTWGDQISEFVARNWQWLWVTILAPVAVMIWGLWRRWRVRGRRKPAGFGRR